MSVTVALQLANPPYKQHPKNPELSWHMIKHMMTLLTEQAVMTVSLTSEQLQTISPSSGSHENLLSSNQFRLTEPASDIRPAELLLLDGSHSHDGMVNMPSFATDDFFPLDVPGGAYPK